MDQWVFVDTCIWVPFFRSSGAPEKAAVDGLLDQDRVALVGPIIAEVLVGFRRKDQADWVSSRLRSAHYAEVSLDDWSSAADLGRELMSLRHQIPLTDLVVAVVARRCNSWIYTTDPHFDLVEGLKRYQPE
jgi:predicted nucleic acid-binding protein